MARSAPVTEPNRVLNGTISRKPNRTWTPGRSTRSPCTSSISSRSRRSAVLSSPASFTAAARCARLGEEGHAAWSDEQSDDDEDDAVEHRATNDCHDARDDEDDGDQPKYELHDLRYPARSSVKTRTSVRSRAAQNADLRSRSNTVCTAAMTRRVTSDTERSPSTATSRPR